jgi:hypothetical protein
MDVSWHGALSMMGVVPNNWQTIFFSHNYLHGAMFLGSKPVSNAIHTN